LVYGLQDGCCVVRHKRNLCQSSWVTRCIIKEQSTLKGIFPSEQQVSGIKLFSKLLGASVRNSAHGKGHEEGGSACAKAGSSLRSPPGNSRASTPKTRVCLLYCFVLSPTPLTLQGLSWAWQECFSSQPWEAWDVLNCLNTDSFEQLKDWSEIVLVKGFSLVGPMFAAKFPYPLPAVSLAVYWLI